MTKKAFYLGTCSTCSRIMKDLNLDGFEMREIKSQAISEAEVEEMKALAGSFEELFSRRSMKYRAWGLHEKELGEQDYKALIMREYTFLKRPVFIVENQIFVGNTKKVVEEATAVINGGLTD
ncbi:MAG: arsenate reductase [Bacteroidetes bacterium]|nr:arsenate reductase [Bacteroidota bacterium]